MKKKKKRKEIHPFSFPRFHDRGDSGLACRHTLCVRCVDRAARCTHARLPLSGSLATVEKTVDAFEKEASQSFGRPVFD